MECAIIDVRERDEFDAEHIENSINLPLSELGRLAPGVLRQLEGKPVVIMCRSGNRATLALQQLQGLGKFNLSSLEVYKGGILEWKKQGKPTACAKAGHLPILRQVQLIAGLLVITGAALAYFVNPAYIFLSAAVGAGLAFAGASGNCLMANMLVYMPWNKTNAAAPDSKGCCD
jgi:rhodanese-related sulfurtransferase